MAIIRLPDGSIFVGKELPKQEKPVEKKEEPKEEVAPKVEKPTPKKK